MSCYHSCERLHLPSSQTETGWEGEADACSSLTASPFLGRCLVLYIEPAHSFQLLTPCSSKEEKLWVQFSCGSLRKIKEREFCFWRTKFPQAPLTGASLGAGLLPWQGTMRQRWFLYLVVPSVELDQLTAAHLNYYFKENTEKIQKHDCSGSGAV